MNNGDKVRVTLEGPVSGLTGAPGERFQVGETTLRNTIDPTAEHVIGVEVVERSSSLPARGTRFLLHRDDPEKGRNPAFFFYRSVTEEMREYTDLVGNAQYSLREMQREFEGYTWSHLRAEQL